MVNIIKLQLVRVVSETKRQSIRDQTMRHYPRFAASILPALATLAIMPQTVLAEKSASSYLKQGNTHKEQGEFEEAIKDLNQAIKINPDFGKAYLNRGIAHYKKGNLNEAINDLQQAKEIFVQQGKLKTPSYQYTEITLTKLYYNLGVESAQKREFEEAIKNYNQAIIMDPDYAAAYANRGMAYHHQKNSAKAIDDLKKAASLYQKQNKIRIYQQIQKTLEQLQ